MKLSELPPALRQAVEGCPFDLLPWIDPSVELPKTPIEVALRDYARGKAEPQGTESRIRRLLGATEFFALADLSRPRVQYAVFVRGFDGYGAKGIYGALTTLRPFARSCGVREFDGVNLLSYARGELPDIQRIQRRAWFWLLRYESPGPSRHNVQFIRDEWDGCEALRQAVDPENSGHIGTCGAVFKALGRARAIRDHAAGVALKPFPRHESTGGREAHCELFWLWQRRGVGTTERRRRWNRFPTTVRVAISGDDQRRLIDLHVGEAGRKSQL